MYITIRRPYIIHDLCIIRSHVDFRWCFLRTTYHFRTRLTALCVRRTGRNTLLLLPIALRSGFRMQIDKVFAIFDENTNLPPPKVQSSI